MEYINNVFKVYQYCKIITGSVLSQFFLLSNIPSHDHEHFVGFGQSISSEDNRGSALRHIHLSESLFSILLDTYAALEFPSVMRFNIVRTAYIVF